MLLLASELVNCKSLKRQLNLFGRVVLFSALVYSVMYGVIWLGAMLAFVILVNWLWNNIKSKKAVPQIKILILVVRCLVVVTILIIGITMRLIFFDICAIPSSSMESALVPGDKVIVNKLAYGPILPQSPFEIPWLNLFLYLMRDTKEDIKKEWWDYHRLQGFGKVCEGDVVIFKKGNSETPYIKRCVAGPGRELIVKDGMPVHLGDAKSMSFSLIPVEIWSSSPEKVRSRLDSMEWGVLRASRRSQDKALSVFHGRISGSALEQIRSWVFVDSVTLELETAEIKSSYLSSIDSTWTIYDFGSVKVPQKSMEIVLDDRTFSTYWWVISNFEGTNIRKYGDHFFIDENEIFTYTFQEDYYFMMGDNRENSNDSRYSQFIPERNIIGRADWILFSNDREFHWNRLFMRLL